GGYALLSLCALWMAWRGVRETRPSDPEPQQSNTDSKRPLSLQLVALMGIVFLTGASSALVWPLLMIFLQDRFSTEVSTLALASLPSALICSFLPSRMGQIGDRWGRKWPMMAGLVISALVSLFLPNLSSLMWLILLWAIEALGDTAATPAQEALVADLTGQERRGAAYGLYTFAASLGAVVGPLVGGWLYDALGYAIPFSVNAAGLMIGAVLIALFIRDQVPGT
ncbi:MAG: MFS transporter, partial [Chloroflexota bacterium]|nr:MFS transporter [Chloroflexota bacterium]